jgi:hypothetical protein
MSPGARCERWLRRGGVRANDLHRWEVEARAFLAGYRAAQRAEAASRRSLAKAEAAIAEQVAHGGDAGDFENRHEKQEKRMGVTGK